MDQVKKNTLTHEYRTHLLNEELKSSELCFKSRWIPHHQRPENEACQTSHTITNFRNVHSNAIPEPPKLTRYHKTKNTRINTQSLVAMICKCLVNRYIFIL